MLCSWRTHIIEVIFFSSYHSLGKISGRIQLLKKTIAIALNVLPPIIAVMKILKLYFFAPAIIGIRYPNTGIDGERKIMSQPYLSNNKRALSTSRLFGVLCNRLRNLLPLKPT